MSHSVKTCYGISAKSGYSSGRASPMRPVECEIHPHNLSALCLIVDRPSEQAAGSHGIYTSNYHSARMFT